MRTRLNPAWVAFEQQIPEVGMPSPYYYPWQFPVTSTYGAVPGAVGDGQLVMDGAISIGTPNLACATSVPFKPADVGKYVIVNGAGNSTFTGALVAKILTYSDAGHVVLDTSAGTTVTGAAVLWGTDDTAAFNSAMSAAATYLAANLVAELYRPYPPNGLFYMIAGPLITTGNANAQIPIPQISQTTSQKATLSLYADIGDGTALPIWSQTAPQVAGAIVSTGMYTSAGAYTTNFGANGHSCVVGSTPNTTSGATVDGFAPFNNVHVVCKNWTTVSPSNGYGLHYTAVNLAACATGAFEECSAMITTNYFTSTGANAFPSVTTMQNGYATGFVPPGNGNNDQAMIRNPTVSGYAFGYMLGEHAFISGGRTISCCFMAALIGSAYFQAPGEHLIKIVQHSAEVCSYGFWVAGVGEASGFHVDADLDTEGFAVSLMLDNNAGLGLANLFGEIRLYGAYLNSMIAPPYPVKVKIRSFGGNGTLTAATPPGWIFGFTGFSSAGSGVAVQNPYWRDAKVYISGGTVTAISAGVTLGGTGGSATTPPTMTATGLTAGSVDWPSGGWLSITQTGSPTVNVCVS